MCALHMAAAHGHWGIVEELLKKGADKDAKSKGWRTPVHLAAANGRLLCVRALLRKGADIEARTGVRLLLLFSPVSPRFLSQRTSSKNCLLSPYFSSAF